MAGHPNILIFMTDHQRRETMPGYGWCKTPNLERFAREAVQFDGAACPSPHCCPSRASFFSGLYPSDHGVWNNVDVGNTLSRGLAEGVRLWSEDLRDAGYRLFYSGKWHVSAEEGPQDRGFELLHGRTDYHRFRRVPDTHGWALYQSRPMSDPARSRRDGEILRSGYPEYFLYGDSENPFNDRQTVDAALSCLRDLAADGGGAPWCLYVGVTGPHDPYCVPQRFLDLYDPADIRLPASFDDDLLDKPALYRRTRRPYEQLTREEHREALRHYLAFCSYEDALFGEVLDVLHATDQDNGTVVMYLSDHGDYAGAHGLWAKGLPCFREAYSIPLMIRAPGCAAHRVDAPVSLTDLAPTILELADVPARRRFAGFSLAPYLRGEPDAPRRRWQFTQTNGNEVYGIQRSVSDGQWKYVFNGFDFDELYDLQNDPDELHNLADDARYAPVIRRMCRALWRFAKENNDNIVNPYIMTALAPYGPGILADPGEE